MCEFCENEKTEKDIFFDGVQRWFMRTLSDGKWYLFYRNKEFLGARGIEIENCPMCGRKLTDDEESKSIEELLEEFKDRFTSEELEEIKELSEVLGRDFGKLWNKIVG